MTIEEFFHHAFLLKLFNGVLKDTIRKIGPINNQNVTKASGMLIAQLHGQLKEIAAHNVMDEVIKQKIISLQKELKNKDEKIVSQGKQIAYFLEQREKNKNLMIISTTTFDSVYSGLLKEVEEGWINRRVNPNGLELFDYSPETQFKKHWNEYTRISRGLILDPKNKRAVARPFEKFFNYQEILDDPKLGSIPDLPFEVTTKADGSLGILYHYDGQWQFSTRGSFESEQAQWATDFLNNNDLIDTRLLSVNHTYLFELVYPSNRVVVDYNGWEGFYFLNVVDNLTGKNGQGWTSLYWFYKLITRSTERVRMVDCHKFNTLEDITEKCETLPVSEEGYVVTFENGFRVKVKGLEYIHAHRMISNVTPLRVWEAVKDCIDLGSLRNGLPDEFMKLFDDYVQEFTFLFLQQRFLLKVFESYTRDMSNKEIGLMLQSSLRNENQNRNMVFEARKNPVFWNLLEVKSKFRDKIFESFRPKDNVIL